MPTFRIHTNAGVYNVESKSAKTARAAFVRKMPHAFITKIKHTTKEEEGFNRPDEETMPHEFDPPDFIEE